MSALLAALGMQLPGREVAVLCQKVENLVVGAPCGIMDQVRARAVAAAGWGGPCGIVDQVRARAVAAAGWGGRVASWTR